ncbi:M24 family metallopeptidase [Coriobacteriales bacterium OH1046]|nr:M24 family metallopeptidase [Coriobacteriales bacterium OH1046]
MDKLFEGKCRQVAGILDEKDIDLWLVMGRETVDVCDPGLRLVFPSNIMGVSAFFFTRDGRRRALVRQKDVEGVEETGCFDEVVGYADDFDEHLTATIAEIDPNAIDIDVDLYDALTDGLTAGLYLRLMRALEGTDYASRISYGKAIRAIRGRKTEEEIELQTEVLVLLNQVCAELGERVRPGITEEWVWDYCQDFMRRYNLTSSWENEACPLVHAGVRSNQGLVHPSADNAVQTGDVFHLSFGCKHPSGYATDFQRSWYVLEPGETEAPEEVRRAFEATIEAIDFTRRTMRPGDEGRYVNRIFNEKLAGFDASGGGHAVGRALHDGCFQLAGDSKVIGELPEVKLEVGNVFTLEVFNMTSRGVIGVEEMIRLTENGGEYLYKPQRELLLIPSA